MTAAETKELLDEKADLYNRPAFVGSDPVLIPRSFSRKENIEISGFLTATLAWGNRTSILKNARLLMRILENNPYEFITGASPEDYKAVSGFVHRTFNGGDTLYFLESLKNIYLNHGGMERLFEEGYDEGGTIFTALRHFRRVFLEHSCLPRTSRHLPDVVAGSAAKRLNMFLRWMVRSDSRGVDLGLWKSIPPSALMLPLDVHSGYVARKLGLLNRHQDDWKAVEEVTSALRNFDPDDPAKYDFALFGLGIFEKFCDRKK